MIRGSGNSSDGSDRTSIGLGEGLDIRRFLLPDAGDRRESKERLEQPSFVESALFATEYAMARLWTSWGVGPAAAQSVHCYRVLEGEDPGKTDSEVLAHAVVVRRGGPALAGASRGRPTAPRCAAPTTGPPA
ncbi:MAG: hypothetical protein GY835_03530 [bacterium]|nr:hypothetical protein [bacterium]